MSSVPADPLVRAYLDELRRAARDLPRRRRTELVHEIEEHLAEAIPPGASEAEIRTALDRLGDADQIVAEERGRTDPRAVRGGWFEWITIILLLLGGLILPILGWLIGLVFLWGSRVWTTRDKLIGSLLVPGGLATAVFLFTYWALTTGTTCTSLTSDNPATEFTAAQTCTGPSTAGQILWIIAIVVLVITPIATAIYLTRRAQRSIPQRA